MKNRENDKMDFTQGSILKKLLRFMVPILGALILQAAYGAVDLLVVGRFGSTSGLSGVSTGSQVLNLVTFVVTQLAMGITVQEAIQSDSTEADNDSGFIGCYKDTGFARSEMSYVKRTVLTFPSGS